MTTPGRNDPCFCGSGRKFKRCCGAAMSVPAEITDADRALAFDLLERLARSRRFASDFAMVAELLHDEASDIPGPLDFEDDISIARVLDWFCFDVPLQNGGTIADEALRAYAGELTPGARRLIAELRDAPLRFLQVRRRFFGGAALLCADVLEPSVTFRIDNRWLAVERHDLLIARIVKRGEFFEIEGDPAVMPPTGKRRLARELRRIRRTAESVAPSSAAVRMLFGAGLLRLIAVFEALLDEACYTAEGDPVRPASACFVIHDRPALLARFTSAHDVVTHGRGASSNDSFTLLDKGVERPYPLGFVVIDGETVRVDTFSPQRAERARARLLEIAGDCVTFDRIDVDMVAPADDDPQFRS